MSERWYCVSGDHVTAAPCTVPHAPMPVPAVRVDPAHIRRVAGCGDGEGDPHARAERRRPLESEWQRQLAIDRGEPWR